MNILLCKHDGTNMQAGEVEVWKDIVVLSLGRMRSILYTYFVSFYVFPFLMFLLYVFTMRMSYFFLFLRLYILFVDSFFHVIWFFFLHFHLFLWLEYDNNSFSLYDLCINQTRWAKPYKFVFWSVQYVLNIIFIYQTSCIVRVIWLVFLQVSPKRS